MRGNHLKPLSVNRGPRKKGLERHTRSSRRSVNYRTTSAARNGAKGQTYARPRSLLVYIYLRRGANRIELKTIVANPIYENISNVREKLEFKSYLILIVVRNCILVLVKLQLHLRAAADGVCCNRVMLRLSRKGVSRCSPNDRVSKTNH